MAPVVGGLSQAAGDAQAVQSHAANRRAAPRPASGAIRWRLGHSSKPILAVTGKCLGKARSTKYEVPKKDQEEEMQMTQTTRLDIPSFVIEICLVLGSWFLVL
jgi:hypothetical protein